MGEIAVREVSSMDIPESILKEINKRMKAPGDGENPRGA
jgi:hypothetical protein